MNRSRCRFWVLTPVGIRNHVLGGTRVSQGEAIFFLGGRMSRPSENYREYPTWARGYSLGGSSDAAYRCQYCSNLLYDIVGHPDDDKRRTQRAAVNTETPQTRNNARRGARRTCVITIDSPVHLVAAAITSSVTSRRWRHRSVSSTAHTTTTTTTTTTPCLCWCDTRVLAARPASRRSAAAAAAAAATHCSLSSASRSSSLSSPPLRPSSALLSVSVWRGAVVSCQSIAVAASSRCLTSAVSPAHLPDVHSIRQRRVARSRLKASAGLSAYWSASVWLQTKLLHF